MVCVELELRFPSAWAIPIPFDSWPCGCVGACDGPAECALAPRERELEAITSSGFDGCHGGPRRVDNLSSVDCCCFICDNLSSYTFFPPFLSALPKRQEKRHTPVSVPLPARLSVRAASARFPPRPRRCASPSCRLPPSQGWRDRSWRLRYHLSAGRPGLRARGRCL